MFWREPSACRTKPILELKLNFVVIDLVQSLK